MAYGQDTLIGIAFQNSFGTAVTDSSSFDWFEFTGESVGIKKPQLVAQGLRGIFDEGEAYEGPNMVEGDLEIEARPLELGVMLRAAFGNPTSVTSLARYAHTFTPRTSDFGDKCAEQPFTLHKAMGIGSADTYYDLNAKSIEFNIANGEFLGAKISITGGSHSQVADYTASFQTGKRFTFDTTSLSIGGTAIDEIADLTISIDNAIEASHTLNGSFYPSRIKRTGWRVVSVSGTLKFENVTEKNAYLDQTERSMILNFRGTTEIQSGYYDELKFDMQALRWEEFTADASGPSELEVSISGKAKYHVNSAVAITVTLTNTRATY